MTSNVELLTTTRTLTLRAPLSGYLVPIERVPDPVFSQKMVGDGIALDPVSQSLWRRVTARSSCCTPPTTR